MSLHYRREAECCCSRRSHTSLMICVTYSWSLSLWQCSQKQFSGHGSLPILEQWPLCCDQFWHSPRKKKSLTKVSEIRLWNVAKTKYVYQDSRSTLTGNHLRKRFQIRFNATNKPTKQDWRSFWTAFYDVEFPGQTNNRVGFFFTSCSRRVGCHNSHWLCLPGRTVQTDFSSVPKKSYRISPQVSFW